MRAPTPRPRSACAAHHTRTRRLFEKLGSTYIKLGQFIASSPSLFPDAYVLEFQKCLDKTEPMPWPTIKAVIEQELKRPLSDVFLSIDETPIATASVAQVGPRARAPEQREGRGQRARARGDGHMRVRLRLRAGPRGCAEGQQERGGDQGAARVAAVMPGHALRPATVYPVARAPSPCWSAWGRI